MSRPHGKYHRDHLHTDSLAFEKKSQNDCRTLYQGRNHYSPDARSKYNNSCSCRKQTDQASWAQHYRLEQDYRKAKSDYNSNYEDVLMKGISSDPYWMTSSQRTESSTFRKPSTQFSREATASIRADNPRSRKLNSNSDSGLKRLGLRMYSVSRPHPDKAATGGEDASFVGKNAFGVFDGVGGWTLDGIDSSRYSRKLATLTAEYINFYGATSVVSALRYAERKNREAGSSTACVVGLSDRYLQGVNVGDSGLIVIRDGAIVFATKTQQHEFNYPFQLGTTSHDGVRDGQRFEFEVVPEDVIIMASDGLWDNVKPRAIVRNALGSVLHHTHSHSHDGTRRAKRAAISLANLAMSLERLETGMSPFAENAQKAGFTERGGKMDDITIIVALVVAR